MKRFNEVNNIVKKTKRNKYTIGNHELVIEIEDALYGEINGTEELLDKQAIESFISIIVEAAKKYNTKYNPIPKSISISHSVADTKINSMKTIDTKTNSDKALLRLQSPFWKLEDVCISDDCKNQLLTALTIIKYKDKIYGDWGLKKVFKNDRSVVLNFYGISGTGKSMTAEAIAHYLGKEMLAVNYSELESKYVGETPKNITEIFKSAEESGAVIVFDEADSFLGKRLSNVSQSADYGVNVTRSVMLMEIEKFNGVIIFTTNMINNYDEAFKRRILANIEFKLPDTEARKRIWNTHIPIEMPIANEVTPNILAKKYEDISGADIKDMVLYAAVDCIRENSGTILLSSFDKAYSYIKSRNSYNNADLSKVEILSSKEISQNEYEKEAIELNE